MENITVAIESAAQTAGEGPHWDDKNKCLLFVDIFKGGVHRWYPDTGKHESVELDGKVGFVVPSSKGGYVIGLNRTLSHMDWDTKTVTKLFEADQRGSKNSFNDGKCDPRGRLWAGTMGFETKEGKTKIDMGMVGCLFSMDNDGNTEQQLDQIYISNGLAWSLDNKTMYYIDSGQKKVYAFDYVIETGSISNQRTVIDVSTDLGIPDGMCIDADGKLWIAFYGGGKVGRYDPETGTSLKVLNFPVSRMTSCCFAGDNLDVLYVTCARSEESTYPAHPLDGSVFKVTGLGVKGLPSVEYQSN